MDAGADGYLLKQAAAEELADAIRAVARGETVLSPIVARRLATQVQRERQHQRFSTLLTLREREILSLIAQGATSKDVARRLSMSAKTVENHRARILTKLGVANTPAAINLAVQQRLLIEEELLDAGDFFI
jgi:DNA-binding NarL/FixJ family response regulator